jgi:hypothetical protein
MPGVLEGSTEELVVLLAVLGDELPDRVLGSSAPMRR